MRYRTFDGVCISLVQDVAIAQADHMLQVCMLDKDMRQEFKDRCKALNQESVIGHCR
ncbi:hypothetical protein B0T16DRAFT_409331 [Cercophora newfieldiana]|uniref:Uncharacterized protein n=1 Tax=Cercophora newfieldiana TaxID=92897 RepID=A0AA39YAI5_9PEZI|nr:hypothetical protein B0T16DRAFT_409331 [Cercophora newfieldiana]